MVSQKAQIKAHQASLEAYAAEEQQEREKARAEARARVLKDFERGLGLGGGIPSVPKARVATERRVELARKPDQKQGDVDVKLIEAPPAPAAGDGRGVKRKFELDESAVEKLAREAEDAALKAIEVEQVGSVNGRIGGKTLIGFSLGRIEKSQAAFFLASDVDSRSSHWASERRQVANHVQRRRTPASTGTQEPTTGTFHLSLRLQDGYDQIHTNMPLVFPRDIKRDEIHPVNLEASGKRDDRGAASEKGEK